MASVRLLIPFLFAAQITAAVGLSGWLAFTNGQRGAEQLAESLAIQRTNRIIRFINTYVDIPDQLLGMIAHPFDRERHEVHELLTIRRLVPLQNSFWDPKDPHRSIQAVVFANQQGDYVEVSRKGQNQRAVAKIDAAEPNILKRYHANASGTLALIDRTSTRYDPRQRPWYQAAQKAGKHTWSPIYSYYSNPSQLEVMAVHPIYSPRADGRRFVGVLGAVVGLTDISDALLPIVSNAGVAFVIEPGGNLVATSTGEPLQIQNQQGVYQRVRASESQHPLIKLSFAAIQSRVQNLDSIKHLGFHIDLAGEPCYVQVRSEQRRGLHWLTIVVFPVSHFMDQVNLNNQLTLVLCGILLVIALWIGYRTARWLTRPIDKLTTMAKLIEAETEATAEVKAAVQECSQRQDEFGQFARLFIVMEEQVRVRQEKLKAQIQQLEIQIDQHKRQQQVQEITESEFFQSLKQRAGELRRKHDVYRSNSPGSQP
uniref:Putative sensor with HAMP domain protein n=1 Tax=Cyanothece sp. (strain PCC 7425 / ATCC 29141) TaxID=395961 RepID=B8HLA6_CYAP4